MPRILLDNFTTYDIREAVKRVNGRAEIEISGGVTLERIPELATTGAQYVSIGALTHSAPAADLSFELEPAVMLPDDLAVRASRLRAAAARRRRSTCAGCRR